MSHVDVRQLYKKGLRRFLPGKTAKSILEAVMAGDDRGVNLEEFIRSDKYLTTNILRTASGALKKGEIKDLSHAIVLLGQEITRNFVLGHTAMRSANPKADNVFENLETSADGAKHAIAAQELADHVRYEFKGVAFGAGYIFDVVQAWVDSDEKLKEHMGSFFERLRVHSFRTAGIAWALASNERISLKLRKHVFPGGMLHDIGIAVLAITYPQDYFRLLETIKAEQAASLDNDKFVVKLERDHFGIAHPEVGSLLCQAAGFLEDYEAAVDYHHDIAILKTREPDLFLALLAVQVGDRLSTLIETKGEVDVADIEKILEQHKANFPLKPQEIQTVVATLRSKKAIP